MAQTQDTGQNTVKITRRGLLETLAAAAVGGIIGGAIVYHGLSEILSYTSHQQQKPYISEYGPERETITITYIQPPVTTTVTETEKVTKTVTKTETVTVTKTVTETRIETLTKPPLTTTTTTIAQHPRNLKEVLFGNSNLEFIPLRILNAKVVSNYSWIIVEDPRTGAGLEIEIHPEYVSRGNINIERVVLETREYNLENRRNYLVYFVLGREGIENAIERDKNRWTLDVSSARYNIIISDKKWEHVYNTLKAVKNGEALVLNPTLDKAPFLDAVWGGSNKLKEKYGSDSIIIIYQNGKQVEEAMDRVRLASYILGIPYDSNPTRLGILNVDTAAKVEYKGRYENGAPIFAIKEYVDTFIAFIHQKGNQLVSGL